MRGLVDCSLWLRSILGEICRRTLGFGGTLHRRGSLSLECGTTAACVSLSSSIPIQMISQWIMNLEFMKFRFSRLIHRQKMD